MKDKELQQLRSLQPRHSSDTRGTHVNFSMRRL